MTDVNVANRKSGAPLLYLRDEALREGIELLFYAYRDFTGEPDTLLAELGYGRAHHRAIHFVGRNPGLPVSDLLKILKITKQSLSRVLKELVQSGYIAQEPGREDRRQRLLTLTTKGKALEERLSRPQRERFARAYREAGPEAVAGYRKVLLGLINADDRAQILKSLELPEDGS
jgi:DNA-binding MarR family transcriptional regulator